VTDGSGLVCAYVLDGRGSGRAATATDIDALSGQQGLLWVHLDLLDPASRRWLTARKDVDDVTADALLALETRPRSVSTEAGLLLVLRGVNTNPGADSDDMVAIRLWIQPQRIISSRRRNLLSIQDMREAIAAGNGPRTSGEFVVMLVERLAERIGNVVDRIEEEIEARELQSVEADPGTLRLQLGGLRRQTAAIRRYLAPQRDALDRLYRQPGPLFTDHEANELREQSDRITRYLEDLDLARERIIVVQEELLSRVAQEQNSRIYLLSVVAAIFLPLTFVTGLLGMNVAGLPGSEDPSAFAVAMLAMLALGAGLGVIFKCKNWI
jgi:zinc transporter